MDAIRRNTHGGGSMTTDGPAHALWTGLEEQWKIVFEEAWTSWCDGNVGVGAVLIDPVILADQGMAAAIVATGRNRVHEKVPIERGITGNWMAHAEMNVFSSMERFTARGCDLYTTLEPCLMCAGTSIHLNVERIFSASHDEFFDNLSELWKHSDYARPRAPECLYPIDGALSRFARMLPILWALVDRPQSPTLVTNAEHNPRVYAAASAAFSDGRLSAVRDGGGTAVDAMAAMWPELTA